MPSAAPNAKSVNPSKTGDAATSSNGSSDKAESSREDDGSAALHH
jgi:hypothetical protein